MLYVEIITKVGEPPLRIPASQVVICSEEGTPLAVASLYGPDRGVKLGIVTEPDFNKTLRDLAINKTVVCERLKMPPPPKAARLLYDPTRRR